MQSSVSIWSKSPPSYLRTHSGGVAVAYSKMAPLYYARKAWSAKMRMQIKLRTDLQVCFLILLGRLSISYWLIGGLELNIFEQRSSVLTQRWTDMQCISSLDGHTVPKMMRTGTI